VPHPIIQPSAFLLLSSTILASRVGRTVNEMTQRLSVAGMVFWSSCPIPSPVDDVMLLSQVVFGLPRPLDPGVVPWMISLSNHSPSFRTSCPKYATFLLFTDFIKSLSTPAVSITQLFVFRAVHDALRTYRKLFTSNALSRFSSSIFNIQLSHPHIVTSHIKAFKMQIFIVIGMLWFFHIFPYITYLLTCLNALFILFWNLFFLQILF